MEIIKNKNLVFNSDDFGMSTAFNEGVKDGFLNGFLTSTCLCANGPVFEQAVKEILPQCEGLGLGVHLNIIEGKSLRANTPRSSMLCDTEGSFNQGFISMLAKSSNKTFLQEVEAEFRVQIEKILEHTEVDHLNSHVHTHGIPAIFEITCKLAKEYKIPFVRTQYEKFYTVPDIKKHLDPKYPVNLIKVVLLNSFSQYNFNTAAKYGIRTNKYLIGVGYTGYMDSQTIEYGVKAVKDDNCITEILIHPCKYDENNVLKPTNFTEYKTTQDQQLKEKIEADGWTLTNYKALKG